MIWILFIFVSAFFNAVMDLLENENYYGSVFRNYNQKWWYKRESWKYVKFLPFTTYRPDGWHIAKTLMIVSMSVALVTYKSILGVFDVLIFGLVWNVSFNLFYSKLKIKKR